MADILISPFDNFFLFIIESQTSDKKILTDLSSYKEAYLTFKDNNNYIVRIKSNIVQDSLKQGELNFTILSYDAQQIRKITDRNFLISLVRDYPDAVSDETVIFTGTWDFFEYNAKNNYDSTSKKIEKNIQAKTSSISKFETEKNELEIEINKLEEEILLKESEKISLENILNTNLARASSLKTSGFIDEESQQVSENKSDILSNQSNIVPSVISSNELIAIKTRGLVKTQIK
jgi:hypothetical protein